MSEIEQSSEPKNLREEAEAFKILDELIPRLDSEANVVIVHGADNQILYLPKQDKKIDYEQMHKLSEELPAVDGKFIQEYLRVQRVKYRNGGKYIPVYYIAFSFISDPDYSNDDCDSDRAEKLETSYWSYNSRTNPNFAVAVHPDVTKEEAVRALQAIIQKIELDALEDGRTTWGYYNFNFSPDYRNGDYDSDKFEKIEVSLYSKIPYPQNSVMVLVGSYATKEDAVKPLQAICQKIESGEFEHKRLYIQRVEADYDSLAKKERAFARLAEQGIIKNLYNKSGRNAQIIGGRLTRRRTKTELEIMSMTYRRNFE